jgi:hypothetical protein
MVSQLQMSDEKYTAMLAKRGVNHLSKLTSEQADEIIERMESLLPKK